MAFYFYILYLCNIFTQQAMKMKNLSEKLRTFLRSPLAGAGRHLQLICESKTLPSENLKACSSP